MLAKIERDMANVNRLMGAWLDYYYVLMGAQPTPVTFHDYLRQSGRGDLVEAVETWIKGSKYAKR